MYTWQCRSFNELTPDELYELLKLRVNIFVVEQQCPYPELDDKDRIKETRHLMGYHQQQLVACARLLPPGASYPSVSIGRVAIAQSARPCVSITRASTDTLCPTLAETSHRNWRTNLPHRFLHPVRIYCDIGKLFRRWYCSC